MGKARVTETKKKAKKEGPKKPMSAYIYYSNKRRPEIIKDQPSLASKITQISKMIGQEWRGLTEEDKVPYSKDAEKDRQRYAREMQEFVKKQAKEKEETEE